jgi:hypothetical protein
MPEPGRPQVDRGVAVGEGADDAGASADLAHDALKWIVGPDAPPVLLWKRVVRQGLGHRRLDQLGRLAEPHAVEPSDDLASFALGGRKVSLGVDGLEHQRHLAQLAGGMGEEVGAFGRFELPKSLGCGLLKGIDGSGGVLADMGLELVEGIRYPSLRPAYCEVLSPATVNFWLRATDARPKRNNSSMRLRLTA